MKLLERLSIALNAYVNADKIRAIPETPELTPDLYTRTGIGLTDSDALTIDQQKTAWRGLLYRCLDIRASSIASAMVQSTVERKTGQIEFEEVEPGHPWVTLIQRPNPDVSPYEFWYIVSQLRDLSGVADLIVRRDSRRVPFELYIAYPSFGVVVPVPNKSGGVQSFIYQRNDGKEIPFEVTDIIRIRRPNPLDPYQNASLIEAAAYQIDSDLYMHIYRRDNLKEGSPPSMALVSDQELTEAAAKRYGEEFKKVFLGVGKKPDRVPVFGKGLKPHPITLSAKDIEFVSGAKLNNTEIMWITGVPEGMLTDEANRANAESSRSTFYQNTVEPELNQITGSLTISMERAFDAKPGTLYVRPPDLMPKNHEFELKRRTEYMKHGLRSLNDLRREDGYEPVEGGDEVLVPTDVVPLKVLLKKIEQMENPNPNQPKGNQPKKENEDEDTDESSQSE